MELPAAAGASRIEQEGSMLQIYCLLCYAKRKRGWGVVACAAEGCMSGQCSGSPPGATLLAPARMPLQLWPAATLVLRN